MEATHSWVTGGLVVAKHAEEKSSTALVHAPIPLRLKVEEIVADWDQLRNHGGVTHAPVMVKVSWNWNVHVKNKTNTRILQSNFL